MYRVRQDKKGISPLSEVTFARLELREREHLQEWIADNPNVLGEDLLIIQKEFSGFDNSNDRLDLLALDKEGNIVVIENKLDDSGKDVTGQGLRYVSFCSTLSSSQIVKIFSEYRKITSEQAKEELANFYDSSDFEEIELNSKQRLILVAKEFRIETTSSVLWLRNNQIDIRCIKSVPYSDGKEHFILFNQIIPVPEVSDYTVQMGLANQERRQSSITNTKNKELKEEFWQQVLEQLDECGFHHFEETEVLTNWEVSQKIGKGKIQMALGNGALRVQLYINSDRDKVYFNALQDHKSLIPKEYERNLIWERRDNAPTSRVYLEVKAQKLYDDFENQYLRKPDSWKSGKDWGFRIDWFVENIQEFHGYLYPLWIRVLDEINARK